MFRSTPTISAAVAALALSAPAAAQPQTAFTNDAELEAPAGHVTLEWERVEAGSYQLEYDADASFAAPVLWYEGPATQSFISGMEEGEHFYRVRARAGEDGQWGAWSAPLHVTVEHQSMRLAWGLFAVGAVLFGSIVAFVVWHAPRAQSPEEPA